MDVAQYILCFVTRYVNIACMKHTVTTFNTSSAIETYISYKCTVCTPSAIFSYAISLRLLLTNNYVNFDLDLAKVQTVRFLKLSCLLLNLF